MTGAQRERFDALVAEAIEALPEPLRELIDRVPVIVLDRPDEPMCRAIGADPEDAGEICGLYTGLAETERELSHPPELPDRVHLFREGIVREAGGWRGRRQEDRVYEEFAVTLLHELGHHFGLDEDDLRRLGYD